MADSPVFLARRESIYDVYGTGHASTSVSAAVGMVEASRLWMKLAAGERVRDWDGVLPDPGRVVAVIGDGALTGGMAYEALNHAGHLAYAAAGRSQRQRHVHREERGRHERLPLAAYA